MARQVINNGAFDNDPSAETIRSAFTKVNAMTTDLYGAYGPPWHNVLAYGAVGNYNSTTDTGTDDTAAIQAAYDAANTAGGYGVVVFPGWRNYKITNKIVIPAGVHTLGFGGKNLSGSSALPTINWRGTAGGTMIEAGQVANNVPSTKFDGIIVAGGRDDIPANWAGRGIDILGGPDTGTFFNNVWFSYINGNGLHISGGVTNGYVYGCRFDVISGYWIYASIAEAQATMQIHDITGDNWTDSSGSPFNKGAFFFDGESGSGATANVHITGFHPEVNGTFADTYASGTNPSDRRGMIRLGVNPSINAVQHNIKVDSAIVSYTSSKKSFSFFQVTSASGTKQQHIDRVHVHLTGGRGVAQNPVSETNDTGVVKLIGNVPAEWEYPYDWRINVAQFIRCGGPIGAEKGSFDVRTGARPWVISGTGAPTLTAPIGTLYQREDPVGTTSRLYINTDGGTTWATFTASA